MLRLETGIHQKEAIGLYQVFGFRRRGRFGEYSEDPMSVFWELGRQQASSPRMAG